MKSTISLVSLLLLTLYLFSQENPKKLNWQKTKLAKGLKWKQIQTDQLFESKQYINVLELNRKRQLSIAYRNKELIPTSQFGREQAALASINAGFFDMKAGGSVTFLKVDDQLINQNISKSEAITKSCIAIDEEGHLSIESGNPSSFYENPAHFEDVLFTGPLLIRNGEVVPLSDRAFNSKRHPRTCACTTKKGKLLLMTIDGRNKEAQGVSLFELTDLLLKMKCFQAINLDGGGSTTMWIKNNGVVNHPSDNRQFDEQGERSVANVIIVK